VGHDALSVDSAGGVAIAYDGAAVFHGPQTIAVQRSADRGETWSGPVTISTVGEMATSPAMESGAAGDVRAWWMETNGGNVDAWNVWYRTSADGGATWSTAVKLSDAPAGAGYKTAAGFAEVYGDYGELAITNTGKSIAIWGEGYSYTGPGAVWFNRQR
jgi:Neuraminidase (sialidase)